MYTVIPLKLFSDKTREILYQNSIYETSLQIQVNSL